MLSAASRTAARATPAVPARGMATEKQIFNRIQSTTSIAKITKSMKMVSAAKLRYDQQRLALARPFAGWVENVFEKSVIVNTDDREEGATIAGADQGLNLTTVITSDRGLCGGVNSFSSKATVNVINELEAEGKEVKVQVFGDKGRPQMRRLAGAHVIASAHDLSKQPYVFDQCCAMGEELLKQDPAAVQIVYNKFASAIAYTTEVLALKAVSMPTEPEQEQPMVEYEFEPENQDEVMKDLFEYGLATALYGAALESATTEQSQRMTAMEAASTNASDMIDALTLAYNRARQSRITTELIEIISGASALED